MTLFENSLIVKTTIFHFRVGNTLGNMTSIIRRTLEEFYDVRMYYKNEGDM